MRDYLFFFLGVATTGFVLGLLFSLAAIWITSGIAALTLLIASDV